jgi:hypothetical protein
VLVSKGISFVFAALVFALSIHSASAQERCGTKPGTTESAARFETWLYQQLKKKRAASNLRTQAPPYTIPVVVHIIHKGEPIGTGSNISDAQVLSQIKVLNQDFQRTNPDRINTPAEFAAVAGSMDITFVLAKRDPEGRASNGIVRVKGTKNSWTSADNYQLKSQSNWPSEDYLNIWVCDITDFLGYAQFPVSNLPGLENSSNNAETDGVVISYAVFGSIDDGNFNLDPDYNKGRTTTHEVSHFFGLKHIWGDDDNECTGTDHVADTPNQAGFTTGCPAHPRSTCNPAVVSMFQNFLDYTDDRCMNLFTQDQVERMSVVLENSPRRKSLLTSNGDLPPDPVNNDLGIRKVVTPPFSQCNATINPTIQIKNYGKNAVTSASIRFRVNNIIVETKSITLNLQPQDSAIVHFNSRTLNIGLSTLQFEIVLTNGVTDGDASSNDNVLTSTVYIPASVQLPFNETFTTLPSTWLIENPDQQITWQVATAPKAQSNNKALQLEFYDYEDNIGELDIIYSPVFDLRDAQKASLFFDVAHARYDNSNDGLRVVVITNCGGAETGKVIYEKSGSSLATVPKTQAYFIPNGTNSWRTEFVNLTEFIGQQFVQLAFIGINDFGNNLYLDNISVVKAGTIDVNLEQIAKPSFIVASPAQAPVITVQNTGTEIINSVTINYVVNGGTTQTKAFSNLNLNIGQKADFTLPSLTLNDGENIITVQLVSPNGVTDDNPSNNSRTFKIVVNPETDRIPLRETFDAPLSQKWTIANPDTGSNWQLVQTNFGQSLAFNAFTNTELGDESWFATPSLDLSNVTEASMQFDVSYRRRDERQENFQILLSTDGGATYEPVDFSPPETEGSSVSWVPQTEDDWFQDLYIDLEKYVGESSVRIAFVISNANGNNFYLDNLEFFVTAIPSTIDIGSPFDIFGYDLQDPTNSALQIGFNLQERQNVNIQVIDLLGREQLRASYADVLNQIYSIPAETPGAAGVYIVRVQIGDKFYSRRILLMRP